jgi:DNA-binding transcriptional MocR family regulator
MRKMSKKVTFDVAGDPDVINFGIGQPSPDLLPVELMRTASASFLNHAQPAELNYGERQGDIRFRESLAAFLGEAYFATVEPDKLLVTGGNSQALDFVCALFTRPGDTVIVEEPSYFLAFQIFTDHGLNIVSVPVDQDGMDIGRLEKVLEQTRAKLLYTIPSYHNPSGQTMSLERRKRLAELSREHDFLIAADEVYQLLYYYQPPPAALGTMTGSGNILSLGSFSKIMAPGLRLGWIQTSSVLMERLIESGVINSGGSFNHFTSHVMRHAIELGLQDCFLQQLRESYRRRVEVMDECLHQHIGEQASWQRPEGGYFFWLKFDESVDVAGLRPHAAEFNTGFQPGSHFSAGDSLHNYMRLSFAHYTEESIAEGIKRLANLLHHQL